MIAEPITIPDSDDEDEEEDNDQYSYTCLVSGESEVLTITTASPPIPPKDLKVSVDYNVAHITWESPVECGTDVIGKVKRLSQVIGHCYNQMIAIW